MEDGLCLPIIFNMLVNNVAYPTARRTEPKRKRAPRSRHGTVHCRKVPYSHSRGWRRNSAVTVSAPGVVLDSLFLLLLIYVPGRPF